MVLVGFVLIIHAGVSMVQANGEAMLADDFVTPAVRVEVVLGALVALWGAIGDFKPIRISDGRRVRWETQHARGDFHNFKSRARFLRPLLKSLPTPPGR